MLFYSVPMVNHGGGGLGYYRTMKCQMGVKLAGVAIALGMISSIEEAQKASKKILALQKVELTS